MVAYSRRIFDLEYRLLRALMSECGNLLGEGLTTYPQRREICRAIILERRLADALTPRGKATYAAAFQLTYGEPVQ